jgi:two-component system response regulator HupR/HoxA
MNVGSALVVALLRASYEGNVRELRNLLLKAMTETGEGDGPLMPPRDLRPWRTPPTMPPPTRDEPPAADDIDALLGGVHPEARRIHEVVERLHWNVSRSAIELGMQRGALIRLMKKLGIERP